MKKIFTLIVSFAIIANANAQRFKDKIFQQVNVDSVLYGNAVDVNKQTQNLWMDIFQPAGDTASKRPLLIFAHGGSFIGGSRKAPDVTYLCTEFAKRGYVCVSIQYRLGVDISQFASGQGATEFANAVWRGTLDGRAAVRYLRSKASDYKINDKQIYLGGVSAGGVLGLHEAFLDLESEVGQADPKFDTTSIGGIEGRSGTPGVSWRVKGVINLCGALADVRWMSNNKNVSIFSVHGTKDQTVPYKTDYFYAFNVPIAKLSGSFVVDSMAKTLGMRSFFHTFNDAPHVPFSPGVGADSVNKAYMDTTENLLRDFLAVDIVTPSVGVQSVKENGFNIYPNPAKSFVTIETSNKLENSVQIFNIAGKLIETVVSDNKFIQINTENYQPGLYMINVKNVNGSTSKKLVIE